MPRNGTVSGSATLTHSSAKIAEAGPAARRVPI
jgi:hypothetical protein